LLKTTVFQLFLVFVLYFIFVFCFKTNIFSVLVFFKKIFVILFVLVFNFCSLVFNVFVCIVFSGFYCSAKNLRFSCF